MTFFLAPYAASRLVTVSDNLVSGSVPEPMYSPLVETSSIVLS